MKQPRRALPKDVRGSPAGAPSAAKTASSHSGPAGPTRPSSRAARSAERREAIIAAGLEEFIARGFAAARLDDVAKRAGVAKGTIYLHFRDKEALFEELIRTAIVPLVARLEAIAQADAPLRSLAERIVDVFVEEI